MKIGFILLGVLTGLFAIAQFLQLLGLIGVGFSIAGIVFTLLGGVASAACFKKAFEGGSEQKLSSKDEN